MAFPLFICDYITTDPEARRRQRPKPWQKWRCSSHCFICAAGTGSLIICEMKFGEDDFVTADVLFDA
jgi:hypothetical protein